MWDVLASAPVEILWSVMGAIGTIGIITAVSKYAGKDGSAAAEAAFRTDLLARNEKLQSENKRVGRQVVKLINMLERTARKCPGECADFIDEQLQAFFAAEDKK